MTSTSKAQELAQRFYEVNDPTGWFEELYEGAKGDETAIPWANLEVNPNLASWIETNKLQNKLQGEEKTALVVGCGLGDDAEALSNLGFDVWGFDISPTAIAWCQKRFPNSVVNYLVDDLLNPTIINDQQFDFILESYTLQALPGEIRPQGIKTIAQLLPPGGRLLVICRGRNINQPALNLPYPLTKEELGYFAELGLRQIKFEDYIENIKDRKSSKQSVRRFRIEYTL